MKGEHFFNGSLTWKAIDQLLDKGLCEEYVFPLLRHIHSLPQAWEIITEESPEKTMDRRKKLSYEIRALALKLEADREAKHIRIEDHETITEVPTYPTLANFLRDIADEIGLKNKYYDHYEEQLTGKKTTRNDLNSFIRREIAQVLYSFLEQPNELPISAATYLSNAVLEIDSITKEQLKDTFKNIMKK